MQGLRSRTFFSFPAPALKEVGARAVLKRRLRLHPKNPSSGNPEKMCHSKLDLPRAVDKDSFFADQDPAVFLNADPDPAA